MKQFIIFFCLFCLSFNEVRSQDFNEMSLKIQEHPRLLFPGKSFDRLRKDVNGRTNTALVGLHNTMMEFAVKEGLNRKPVPVSTAKKHFNSYSRQMSPRIFTAAYAFRLTRDRQYLDQAIQNIEVFIDMFREYHTGDMLENSELWISLALAYDWLYPMLDKNTKNMIIEALDEFGFDAVDNARFFNVSNNLNCVCNSALVCAAIATYEAHPEKSLEIIRRSVKSNALGMKGVYYPDGVSPESPSYWDYASNYEAIMLMALEDNFGTDFGLSSSKGFEKGGLYRVFVVGNTGDWFNYGDCNHGGAQTCTALWYYAWKFNRRDLMFRDLEKVGLPGYSKSRAL